MNLRKTFKWCLVFLLLLAGAAGGVGYWFWMRSDELLRTTILTHADKMLPEADVRLGKARFDFHRRIRLYDVELKPIESQPPLISIPEIVMTIDQELLTQEQRVLVHKVNILRPTIELRRHRDGSWNWQSLWPLPKSDNSLPEFEIEGATVTIHWEPDSGVQHTSVTAQNVDMRLIPSGHRQFHIAASGQVNFSGTLKLDGQLDLERESWAFSGEWNDLKAGAELGQLIATVAPQVDQKIHNTILGPSSTPVDPSASDGEQSAESIVNDSSDVASLENDRDDGNAATDTLSESSTRPSTEPSTEIISLESEGPQQVSTIWTEQSRQPDAVQQVHQRRLWDTISAHIDLGFEISSPSMTDIPTVRLRMLVGDGRVEHPDLPFILNEIVGTIIWENDSLEIRDMKGSHGSTQFELQGHRRQIDDSPSSEWHVRMTNLMLDRQLRETLRGGLARIFDMMQPRGVVDLVFDLREVSEGGGQTSESAVDSESVAETDAADRDDLADAARETDDIFDPADGQESKFNPRGIKAKNVSSTRSLAVANAPRWRMENLLMTVKEIEVTPEKFPYKFTQISGQLQQKNQEMEVTLTGMAGKRPVVAKGVIRDPGENAGVDIVVQIDNVPIDDALLSAMPANVRPTIDSLHLTGTLNGAAHIVRAAGPDRIWTTFVEVDVSKGTLQYDKFPYRLLDLAGHVVYSSASNRWSATNITASRGKGRLKGEIHFRSPAYSHEFSLALTGSQISLDGNLQQALPDGLRRAWDAMDLRGSADLSAIVLWNPGEEVELSLPSVEVTNGSLQLDRFRYPLDQIRSKFNYHQGVIHFHSFVGRHDETQVRAKGTMALLDDNGWKLTLDPIYVDDLLPNRSFRNALSPDLKKVIDAVDLQHPLSSSGKVTFTQRMDGDTELPLTATFDLETVLAGNSLNVGVELKSLFGRITSAGTWDGEQCEMMGAIDLESMLARGYYITQVQGPYRWQNQQLVVGSRKMAESVKSPDPQNPVSLQERLSGKVIGGILTLDSVVDASSTSSESDSGTYQAVLTLSDGKLETYASQYLTDQKDLRGVVNAWMSLQGLTAHADSLRGRGQMQISPAALYELPVVVQLLQLTRPGTPEKAAFQYVFLDFNIISNRVEFTVIDLVGDTISLRGRGTATMDGKLDLDFYSTITQNQFSIPIVGTLLGEATKGWVGVKVRGDIEHPDAEIQPLKNLDSALKLFLGAFDPGKGSQMQRFFAPPRGGPPRAGPLPPFAPFAPNNRPRPVNPQSSSPGQPSRK